MSITKQTVTKDSVVLEDALGKQTTITKTEFLLNPLDKVTLMSTLHGVEGVKLHATIDGDGNFVTVAVDKSLT